MYLSVCWHFFFFTNVDRFNICQPSFAKVAMWIIIMADFLNENINIVFALFQYYYYYYYYCYYYYYYYYC